LAPFFAMTKEPSMKHSVKSSPPRSFTSSTSVRRISSNTPKPTHSWKHWWQVWYDGYRSGISFHWAPVCIIHKMPFGICRSSILGRPRLSARTGGLGIKGCTIAHYSSVISIGSSPFGIRAPVYHF
jgi:hypothetical protein